MKLIEPPEYFNFAEDVLGKRAAESPGRTAILSVDEGRNETHWTLRQQEQTIRSSTG